ncbi:MAG: ATP-dependent Clp protease proteolytic subunit, partial [Candidatus Cloacimonadota bacterium]|nr:ATP-dependent Clp protease proteolytic subunit [Candidatus Cloacimonadota bacterium]
HTYNDGLTASMASIIMLAGITHFPKTSLYHLHRSSTIAIGNASDFQDEIDNLLKFEHTIKQVLSSRTNLSFSDIENFWFDGKDHFLTATEAQEFGFVDFIEDTEVVLPAPENKLQTMDYAAVLDLYGKIPDVNNNGIINNIINKLSHRHNNKNKTDMKTIKSGLLNLLFILSLDEFSFNSEKGNVEISLDDAIKLNDEVKNLQDHETELKNEAETHKNEITNLKIKVSDLQAKLDDTAQNNTNPKVNDTNTDDYDDSSINEETMTNLRAYNKLNHIQ